MRDYLLVSTALSLFVLLALPWLRSAPPRLRFWVCFVGMSAWGVPWPHFVNLLQRPSIVMVGFVTGVEPSQATLAGVPPLPVGFDWFAAFWVLTTIGLVLFGARCARHILQLKAFKERAQAIPHVWKLRGLGDVTVPVFAVSGFDNAFVSGYFRPRIWVGKRRLSHDSIATVLQHELMHIKGNDNFSLFYVALFRDLFWWNPLVRALTKRARELVELSCDQRCNELNPDYQQHLARNLLGGSDSSVRFALSTPISGKRKFNIYRLTQLDMEFAMKKWHFIPLIIVALAGLGACAIQAASVQDHSIINHLYIKTAVGENTNEVETEFIGEPEVKKLLSLARSTSAVVEVKLDGNRREIRIESTSQRETERFLHAFDGTPMEGFFVRPRSDPALSGVPMLIDFQVEIDKQTVFEATLATNNTHWTGISSGDHLFRIMTTLMPNRLEPEGEQVVRIDAEISQKIGGSYEVIDRPRFVTRLGEQGTIIRRTDTLDIRLELTASKVD